MQKDLKISQRTTRQPLSLRDINLLFLEKISRECELFFFFCIFVSNFGEVRKSRREENNETKFFESITSIEVI